MAKVAEFGGYDWKIYNSFEEILEDSKVDIVSICTPNDLHAQEAILAAKAGKHIFLEKPAAINKEELEELDRVSSAKVASLRIGDAGISFPRMDIVGIIIVLI